MSVGALMLVALTAVLVVAPGTVLASSAADQYAEPQLPQEPPKAENSPGSGSNSKSKPEDRPAGSGDDPDTPASASPSSDSSLNTPTGSTQPGAGIQRGQKDREQADGGKKDRKSSKANEKDRKDRAEQALFGTGSSDGGDGSTLPLIALLLIGIPVLAAGGYLLYRRYGGGQSDPEMRARVQEAVSDGKGSSAS